MEIRFLHETFTEKDPELLIDHIQRMVSGEAPFFPTTLSLVYDRLVEQTFPKHISPGPGLWGLTKGQNITTPTPVHTSAFAFGITSPSTPITTPPPITTIHPLPARRASLLVPPPILRPASPNPTIRPAGLRCIRCHRVKSINNLYNNLHCPQCPANGRNGKGEKGRPFMCCTKCGALRDKPTGACSKPKCRRQFV